VPAEQPPPLPLARAVLLCDAAAATGLGHFVRCTALAGALSAAGTEVQFLLPEDSLPRAVERVRTAGWQVRTGPWEDAADLAAPGTAVVVDTYRVDGDWLTALHRRLAEQSAVLAVIDDQADRAFSADLVLNQNVGAEQLGYPGTEVVLAGPVYALLRPEFARSREAALRHVPSLPDRPGRVLVLFGGTDASGMAMVGARAARLAFPDAEVRAVVPGADGAPDGDPGIILLPPVDAIHEEMLRADLVVSAGGTTLWELCCLARPTAVVAVAGNQQPAYDEMSRRAAILPAGRTPVHDPELLADRLRELVVPGALRATAERAADVTDGRGVDRVAEALSAVVHRTAQPGGSPA
jgi:spore coat polysaccharide biosynthesis predicted glycosyltransferase SpsG